MSTKLGREVSETCAALGISTDGTHVLQFYLYFPEEASGQTVANSLLALGIESTVSKSVDGERWLCFGRGSFAVNVTQLDELGDKIAAACKTQNGVLDGWDLDQAGDDGESAETLLRHALGLYQQGNHLRAGELLKRVGESGGEKAAIAWTMAGMACVRLEQHVGAVAAFDRVLQINPNDPEALAGKAASLVDLGRPEDAIEHFDKSISIKPEMGETHLNMAAALAMLGRNEEATSRLKEAIACDERMKKRAKQMSAFKNLRGTPAYDQLVGKSGGLLGWLKR